METGDLANFTLLEAVSDWSVLRQIIESHTVGSNVSCEEYHTNSDDNNTVVAYFVNPNYEEDSVSAILLYSPLSCEKDI
uniref:SET domain-containing protein n=1 Tax=Heterorhabditis bacteriophora TaxID=37862 RepID=A0A1I7XL85_HETBA